MLFLFGARQLVTRICLSTRPQYISSENLAIVRRWPFMPVPASLVAARYHLAHTIHFQTCRILGLKG